MSFDLEWNGEEVKEAISESLKINLVKIGLDLQRLSVKQAPVDIGDLRGDCSVDTTDINDLKVNVGYSLEYALTQHEHLEYNHPKGGKAKFLEDPYNENVDKYIGFLTKGVKGAIK